MDMRDGGMDFAGCHYREVELMFEVNTNLYAQNVQNYFRQNQLQFTEKTERLSSGARVNRGADDPSGLGIANSMGAQIRGMNTAVQNMQDGINLIRFTDGFLNDVQSTLFRMRDLSIKLSNEAVNDAIPGQNQSDRYYGAAMETYKEILNLGDHLWKSIRNYDDNFNPAKPLVNYNTKQVFQGEFDPPDGQQLQIGPDNNISHQVGVLINDLTPIIQGIPVPYDPVSSIDGRMNPRDYMTIGNDILQNMDDKINFVSDIRLQLGAQDNILQHAIKDIAAETTNMADSKSMIIDADMAVEIVDLSKNLILKQSTDAAAAQANASPQAVKQLLEAIYNGVSSGFYSIMTKARAA